ncbi:MAG TPA: class I SAM-dependent methyltransferase [Pyrinomonadaceae bacterium]|nr:class I SAM-dependent methyltransferase [Pyrinomonadaceae bacterium]
MSSTIQTDFDRIALVSPEGEVHNEHYHNFLFRHLPSHCDEVLEIGCGTGSFARGLAARSNHVLALDLSPEMIHLAREKSKRLTNIEFQVGDILQWDLPAECFDCIAGIATLHHLPFREVLLKLKAALKPRGVLLILDLFEPRGAFDWLLNFPALTVSTALRLIHHRRLFQRSEARAAWAAHEAHDLYPTMNEVRAICADLLPNAKVKQHLLWRYSIVWHKPAGNPG